MTGIGKLERLLREVRSEIEGLRPGPEDDFASVERFREELSEEERNRFGELLERHHHLERAGGVGSGGTNHGPGGPLAEKGCGCTWCSLPDEPLTERERAELVSFLIRVGALEAPEHLQVAAEGSRAGG